MIDMQRTKTLGLVVLLGLSQALAAQQRPPDVIYVPTRQTVVDAMLNVAKVKAGQDAGVASIRLARRAAYLPTLRMSSSTTKSAAYRHIARAAWCGARRCAVGGGRGVNSRHFDVEEYPVNSRHFDDEDAQ